MRRRSPIQAGTVLSRALSLVGITEERIQSIMGKHCRCKQRARRLNELSDWAWTILRGRAPDTPLTDEERQKAIESLERIEGLKR